MEREGWLRWIKDSQTLDAHLRAWEGEAPAEPFADSGSAGASPSRIPSSPQNSKEPLGFILSMEGADPVLSPDQVHEWWQVGLRIIGPAHYGVSPYAHGTDTEGGLFPQGPALLKAMEQVGMILDVTHLADQSFDEALDIYGGPVLASHHNCRALVPHQRQLTDDQIKRLIGRGAVIGSALDTWMLYPGWVRGQTTPEQAGVKLEAVVDHIDRVCQIAGNARHAAIGSDLDGGFGKEQSPLDLDTIADLQRLPDLLHNRGYDSQAIEGIMYGNWVRFFKAAWAKR
jgi:membrane dipeptidase